jgi:GH15 family glucan-1,4-alpha-glucosidase
MTQITGKRLAIWRRSSFRLVTGSVTAIVLALNLGVQNAFPQSLPSGDSANLTAAKPMAPAKNLTNTSPTVTSAAIYASNWQSAMAIWNASKLNQNDTGTYGPRIAELRSSSNWATNQIVDYSGFFQDTTNSVKYDQIHNFDSSAYLDESGTLNSTYGKYSSVALPIQVKRDYVMVPNQKFLVARYTLTNPSASAVNWKVLDQVHLNNTVPANNVSASYDATRKAFFGDMTASGQSVVTLGAFQTPTSYQAGNDADCVAAHPTASAWCQFDTNGVLSNNATLATPNVDLGLQNSVTIPANSSQTLYYYLGLGTTLATAQAAADTARAQTGAYWFTTTASNYSTWLAGGNAVSTTDTGVNTAYLRNLVVMKNSQNPTNGLFPAATNPGSYGYKAWVRDSSFDAMALDAAGHYAEAAQYWNWMATNMLAGGTWHTTYDLWSGNYVSFVEPEYDSIGQFLTGVYKHYTDTGSASFLTGVWSQVQAAANFVQSNIGTNGFGPADASIWEESVQFNVFTQAFYIAGLRAAALLAKVQSSPTNADNWNGSATTILSAVQRSYSWSPAGMFNDTTGYYNRGVSTTGAVNPLIDSSSLALIVLGDIEANSSRATSMVSAIETSLTHDGVGLARYTGDPYYYSSPYNPAGNEAGSAEPTWPNVTMFDAMYEVFTGRSTDAFAKLQWYASRSGIGYMPPGEAVSWKTGQPIISTMSEPLTASSFIMAALSYGGSYDPRITASNTNLGAAATINVTTNAHADWPQWKEIPYASTPKGASLSGSSMTDVRRVYVSNDATNLYVRVDNSSGALSGFNTAPKFGLLVYAQDFNHSGLLTSRSVGQYGRTLDHPMNYLAGRWSDGTNFSTFAAGASAWNFTTNLGSIAPQWDTTTGRIEAQIPLSSFASSGSAAMGSWSNLDVEIAYQNPSTGTWADDNVAAINYRLTGSGTAWLYGNTLGKEMSTLTTDKARYATGASVNITGRLVNPQTAAQSGATLTLHYTHVGVTVGTDQTATVNLAAGQAKDFAVSWSPPTTDYQGYLVQATLTDSTGSVLDTSQTAVDVSSNWNKFPRYGFVTDFSDNYNQTLTTNHLNLYHLDGIQFYDSEWKHHIPLAGTVASPASSWVNIDSNTNYMHSIQALISDAHGTSAVAMSYNLIYGAWAGYGTDGSGVNSQWGLWYNNNCTSQANVSLPDPPLATPYLFLFDPGNTNWQSYIFGKEQNANSVYAFDGWQADGFGSIGTVYSCSGTSVNLANEFSGFLTNAHTALGGSLVFNAVGQYGQQQIAANADLAFLYTECWPFLGQTTYNDLRTSITNNNTWSGNAKSTVLAAYPDQTYSNSFSSSAPGFFNTPGVLYEDATIFASGASHIELGDVDHMLDQPNYLNWNLDMPAALQQSMVSYYNFLTAYENLLRDGLSDSSNAISFPGGPTTSTSATAGTVWTFARAKTGTDVLHFINMLNLTSVDWMDTNATQPAPTVKTNVAVKYYYTSSTSPSSVRFASPDVNGGTAQSLSFSTGTDGGGHYVTFTLPTLNYWDMAWVNY